MAKPQITADQMRRALYHHFADRWAVVFEVTARGGPGFAEAARAVGNDREAYEQVKAQYADRRIDVLLIRRSRPRRPTEQRRREQEGATELDLGLPTRAQLASPATPVGDDGGFERIAIEIKVTRSDFLADVRNPAKQARWRELADRHAYAVPAGLVSASEVPAESGLIEVEFDDARRGWTYRQQRHGRVVWRRTARRYTAARPLQTEHFLDAFYRWSRADALVRGITAPAEGVDGGDVEAMRLRLAELEKKVERATTEAERQASLAAKWRRRYALLAPPQCATCGEKLVPTRGQYNASRWNQALWNRDWDHTTRDAHESCEALRRAAASALVAAQVAAGGGLDAPPIQVPAPVPVGLDDVPAPT